MTELVRAFRFETVDAGPAAALAEKSARERARELETVVEVVQFLEALPSHHPGIRWEAFVESVSRTLVFYDVDDRGCRGEPLALSVKSDELWPPARDADDDWVVLSCAEGTGERVAAVLGDASPEDELLAAPDKVRLPTRFSSRAALELALREIAHDVVGRVAGVVDVSLAERYGVILSSDGPRLSLLFFFAGTAERTSRVRSFLADADGDA